MTVPDTYLKYPMRHYGMDHDRYDWSNLFKRKPVTWPNQARVALWVAPSLEWFPMDLQSKPVSTPGGYNRPYPDFRNYSHRDYGLRVGIFRVMKLLDSLGIKGSVPMNSAVAERYPYLVNEVNDRGWEILGHGVHMGHIQHGAMEEKLERELVHESVTKLRMLTGQPIRGWLSIGKSESSNTPDLVKAEGIEYLCDWANDDMPYSFRTKNGPLWVMPHSQEIDDRLMLLDLTHREHEFVQQIKDQFDLLYEESNHHGGRIMSIALHPWIIGHPYRIRYLAQALQYIVGHKGVWSATGAEILDAFKAQKD